MSAVGPELHMNISMRKLAADINVQLRLLRQERLLSFYAVMQEKGINPEIQLPANPIFRNLDASAVNRIFLNIISNAIKYSGGDLSVVMDEKGCITFFLLRMISEKPAHHFFLLNDGPFGEDHSTRSHS